MPGSKGKTEKYFESYLRLVPDDAEAHFYYGAHLLGSKQFEPCLKHLQIAADAGTDVAFEMMGLAYMQLGRKEEARASFRKFQEKHPDDPQVKVLMDALDAAGARN
jgi:tetratricopeptide (TPR) repeat protein